MHVQGVFSNSEFMWYEPFYYLPYSVNIAGR